MMDLGACPHPVPSPAAVGEGLEVGNVKTYP